MLHSVRSHRSRWIVVSSIIVLLAGLPSAVIAQPSVVPPVANGTWPMGTLRAGPLGLNPLPITAGHGQVPIALQIDRAEVDAEVEQDEIVNGTMQDPSGPWVVSWYEKTARLGERGNTVMSGHLDYWGVGPAVFYNLSDLEQGDEIRVTAENGRVFSYRVTWARLYHLDELSSRTITTIVGPTSTPSLTLITCGGPFDEATGQYLARFVVRAELVSTT